MRKVVPEKANTSSKGCIIQSLIKAALKSVCAQSGGVRAGERFGELITNADRARRFSYQLLFSRPFCACVRMIVN